MELDFPKIEERILKFWRKNKIFDKLRKKNQGKIRFSFLDGPITANNPMGVHHAWGRTYKDLFQRYKAMQGFDQRFQNGFDCQGLWVEVEVEKELGFKTKKDIEKFGIGKFVKACKERALKYSKIQTEQSIRLGQWMDWKNSYYTMSDENNYAIWYFLKKCWEKGLLYKGRDVVPWCPRCGTAISQHEILTEEYKEIVHKSIFFKLPIIGRKNTFFLVWTTTPWTLPANVALAVHPEFNYAEVKNKTGDIFILLKDKSHLVPGGKIIKIFKGKKLKNLKYQGLFNELPAVKKALLNKSYSVIFWKEVSKEEGTGIVHIAPGCGQEDFQLSKEFNLPVIDPTDNESIYNRGFGFLAEKSVTGISNIIFESLSKKNSVFKIEDYKHRYPTCWRCKSELIFRLVDEWYISMAQLRKPLMNVARKIKWIPSFGLKREIDWLTNMQDWLISKKRYWGLALPIYECAHCGNFEVIGSKEELKKRATMGWKEFEGHSPHRPWVDKVKIKCSKCKELTSRIADVGNPWLDAGIIPFSTMRYFTDRDYWQLWFPANFICESFPGQFKNWFYSLIVMSTVLENAPSVETIFGYASVRDEKEEEMHKSKGNVIWFDEAVKRMGADLMRWMYATQNPIYNLKFGYRIGEEKKRKLLILWNSFVFFRTYIKNDEFPKKWQTIESSNILDKWITSRLHNVIGKVTKDLDRYNAKEASLAIENFFIEDLSLWYIRRSRKRFQQQNSNRDKKEAAETLYAIFLYLAMLISPILPFLSEEIYLRLRKKDMPKSIHLWDWPEKDKEKINMELEKKMADVRKIVALALAERQECRIKVRQPLLRLKLKSKMLSKDKALLELIKDEINVKEIVFDSKAKKEVKLDTKITPSLKEEGMIREVIRNIQGMRKKAGLMPNNKIIVSLLAQSRLNKVLAKKRNSILEKVNARELNFGKKPKTGFDVKKEVKIDQQQLLIRIKKL